MNVGCVINLIPRGSECGYHIEFDLQDTLLNRPCCPVELGSFNDPANPKRFEYLERHVRRVMGLTDPVARKWLGFRPSLLAPARACGEAKLADPALLVEIIVCAARD